MKTYLLFVFIKISILADAQSYINEPDSLKTIRLQSDTLNYKEVKKIKDNIDQIKVNFFRYFPQDESNYNYAFYTDNKNEWLCIELPFENPWINSIEQINLDGKGKKELIIKGDSKFYGNGGGTGHHWILVLNVDSIPTQMMKITYGCWEESFGDPSRNGEGRFVNEYKRTVEISETGILIAPLDEEKYPFETCRLTAIPPGKYVVKDAEFQLQD